MPTTENQRRDGIAREAERREITGVPQSTWRVMQSNGTAPLPVCLGARSVGWLRAELYQWCDDRVAERDVAWQSLGEPANRVLRKFGSGR